MQSFQLGNSTGYIGLPVSSRMVDGIFHRGLRRPVSLKKYVRPYTDGISMRLYVNDNFCIPFVEDEYFSFTGRAETKLQLMIFHLVVTANWCVHPYKRSVVH